MLGGNQLGCQVLNLAESWTPSAVHGHENKFQSELQEYLDECLNSQRGGLGIDMGMGGGGHTVSTERGTSYEMW